MFRCLLNFECLLLDKQTFEYCLNVIKELNNKNKNCIEKIRPYSLFSSTPVMELKEMDTYTCDVCLYEMFNFRVICEVSNTDLTKKNLTCCLHCFENLPDLTLREDTILYHEFKEDYLDKFILKLQSYKIRQVSDDLDISLVSLSKESYEIYKDKLAILDTNLFSKFIFNSCTYRENIKKKYKTFIQSFNQMGIIKTCLSHNKISNQDVTVQENFNYLRENGLVDMLKLKYGIICDDYNENVDETSLREQEMLDKSCQRNLLDELNRAVASNYDEIMDRGLKNDQHKSRLSISTQIGTKRLKTAHIEKSLINKKVARKKREDTTNTSPTDLDVELLERKSEEEEYYNNSEKLITSRVMRNPNAYLFRQKAADLANRIHPKLYDLTKTVEHKISLRTSINYKNKIGRNNTHMEALMKQIDMLIGTIADKNATYVKDFIDYLGVMSRKCKLRYFRKFILIKS